MGFNLAHETAARGRDLVLGFIREISESIGPPAHSIDSIDVSVLCDGPALGIRDDGHVTIYVGPNAINYEPAFIANLAHETVHLHEWTTGYASGLEEGFAVAFELSKVEASFGVPERRHFVTHLPCTYVRVLEDYQLLASLEPNAAQKVRSLYGKLSGPTAYQLRSIFPKIGWRRSYRLARRMRMR